MKLEVGKLYELSDRTVHKGHACCGDCVKVGPYHYMEETAAQYPAHGVYPTVVREVEPLRLEVGKMYETTDGVKLCTDKYFDLYHVGGFCYLIDGTKRGTGAPKILYKLRVNELPEPEAPKSLGIEIPKGWELSPDSDAKSGEQYERDGKWVSVPKNTTVIFIIGYKPTIIRPLPPPFRIDGPGWYKTERKCWIHLDLSNYGYYWKPDGESNFKNILSRLIAKATPEQARILDAL